MGRRLLGRVALAGLACGLVVWSVGAPSRAEDAPPAGVAALKSKFFRGLIGTWDTEITEGAMGKGKGRSTWSLALGETAAVEDYDLSLTAPDGTTAPMRYHIIVREPGPGNAVEGWMFDESEVAPKHFVGTYGDTGFEATSRTPDGDLRVTCTTQGADRVFHLYMGDTLLQREVYRPSKR